MGNFLTAVILARTLSATQFGAFSLLFLALFSINTLHQSLVIYPLTLAVAQDSEAGGRQSTGRAIAHTGILWLPWLLILSAVLLALHRLDVMAGMTVAMLAWQLQEVARRALLASARARAAILPDVISYIGQAAILIALRPHTLNQVFLCIAATSAAALAWQLVVCRPAFTGIFHPEHTAQAWRLGKYSLAANILTMAMLQFPGWLLRSLGGLAVVGAYQALANLMGIANPIIFSMSNMLIPSIARASRTGPQQARRVMVRYGLRFGYFLLPCFLVLALFPHIVMTLAYGSHSPYLGLAPLLRIIAFTFAVQYFATIVGAYEGGMSRPRSYMYSQVAGLILLITLGSLLMRLYGVTGAAYAGLIAASARLVTFVSLSRSADLALERQTVAAAS